jgi:PAS domain S-box-containing protein
MFSKGGSDEFGGLDRQKLRKDDAVYERSEAKFHAMYDRAYAFVGLLDADGLLLEANRRALDFVGATLAEVRGRPFWETPWWEACDASRERLKAAIARGRQGESSRFETVHVNRRGDHVDVDFTLTPVFDAAGNVVQLQPEGHDITQAKRAIEALRNSEERLRLAIEAAGIAIFIIDVERQVVHRSPELAAMLDMPDVTDVPLEDAIARIHHDDVQRARSEYSAALRGDADGRIRSEIRFVQLDGTISWIGFNAKVKYRGNATDRIPIEVVGACVDITRRKQAEIELHDSVQLKLSTLQAMPAHIAVVDQQGRILFVNEAWREFAPGNTELGVGANYLEACRRAASSEPDAVSALNGVEDVLAGKVPRFAMEYPCHSSTEQRWFQMTAVPLANRRGAVIAHLNITDAKRAEEVLADANLVLEARVAERTRLLEHEMKLREQAQAALAQSQRMEALGQLTGGIAHDFNNLLTVISGNLELAEARIADPAARQSVCKAIEAVGMGASLNRRLLSFARRRKLTIQRIVLNDRVSEMQILLKRTLGEEITLSTQLDSGLWPTQADPGEIDSAIINVAINARDAMPMGGTLALATRNVTLDASAARQMVTQPGDYVCLALSDTGHGMTPEVLRRAIEPLFTTKEMGKGTGLGLSSVYGFAKQSGGFVDISSDVGKGTTVSIFLPRAAAEAGRDKVERRDEIPTGNGELILVVEDNDQVRQVTLARLESLGYDVMEAQSGPEAIEVLKNDVPVALVFSDVVMPGGMTGFDVARWARSAKSGGKVLLTSGNEELARPYSDELPGLRVLSKPYSRAQLAHAIHDTLAGDSFQTGRTSAVST